MNVLTFPHQLHHQPTPRNDLTMNSSHANRQLKRHRQYRARLHSPPSLPTIKEERSFRLPPKARLESLFEEIMQQHRELGGIEPKATSTVEAKNTSVNSTHGVLHEISLA